MSGGGGTSGGGGGSFLNEHLTAIIVALIGAAGLVAVALISLNDSGGSDIKAVPTMAPVMTVTSPAPRTSSPSITPTATATPTSEASVPDPAPTSSSLEAAVVRADDFSLSNGYGAHLRTQAKNYDVEQDCSDCDLALYYSNQLEGVSSDTDLAELSAPPYDIGACTGASNYRTTIDRQDFTVGQGFCLRTKVGSDQFEYAAMRIAKVAKDQYDYVQSLSFDEVKVYAPPAA